MILSCLLLFFSASSIGNPQDQKKQIEQEIAKERIKLKKIEDSYSKQQAIVLIEERKLSNLVRKLQSITDEESNIKNSLENLNLYIAKTDAYRNQQLDHLKKIYFLKWQLSIKSYISPLLSIGNIDRARRLQIKIGLLKYLARSEVREARKIDESTKQQNVLIKQRQDKLKSLEVFKSRYKAQVEEVEKSQRKIVNEANKLKKLIGSKKHKLRKKTQHYKKILATIKRLAREAANQSRSFLGESFFTRKGKLRWPVDGLLNKVKQFNQSDGVEFSVHPGTYVRAVHGGKVVFADAFPGFNMLVIVDHGDGYYTLYGYNQSLFKDEGDIVKPDDIIAVVGGSYGFINETSKQKIKNLAYFEIRNKSKSVNALEWLRHTP